MRRGMVWGLLLHGLLLGTAGCAGPSSGGGAGVDVQYGVTVGGSNCPADITYQALSGQPVTLSQQTLPWHYDFTVPSNEVHGFVLSLSATIQCVPGTVTANIVVNGALYASATGEGPAQGLPVLPAVVQTTLF